MAHVHWLTCTLLLVISPWTAWSQERLPGVRYLHVLSRVEFNEPETFALTAEQYDTLIDLSLEESRAYSSFLQSLSADLESPELRRQVAQWRQGREPEIARQLTSILLPFQLEAMVRDANQIEVAKGVNRARREKTGGFALALPLIHDLLELNSAQRSELLQLDQDLRRKLEELADELARLEDELAERYGRRLIAVLEREQRLSYQTLVGEPAQLARQFTAQGRRAAQQRSRPPITVQVIEPDPRMRLDEQLIERTAQMLVLLADLEGDLILVVDQQRQFHEIRGALEEQVYPQSLRAALMLLVHPPQVIDAMDRLQDEIVMRARRQVTGEARDDATEEAGDRLTNRQLANLARQASQQAMEQLLPHQHEQLRRVALQYIVGRSGAKFPLRFPWVRKQVDATAAQQEELDALLEAHDEELAELAAEFERREIELRQQGERDFHEVLTEEQQQLLWQYINPPDWWTDDELNPHEGVLKGLKRPGQE